ncbi:MAG: NAD(P)H-dependent oxidoreductase subunit E [Deltaproteobacteria bacterium]|nr:NAD(P)H-dependent oxidoreductase subunit E [Deltaproteobacteria bacterium]
MSEFLETILEGRKSQPHQLIEVLHDIQQEKGYISRKSGGTISRELGVPLIEVYRVANFYKAFSLEPRGKHIITLCSGTACHVRGANPLLNQAMGLLDVEEGEATEDGLFTVESVHCIGTCALAPVVVLNGVYHPHMTPAKLRALIKKVRRAEEESAHA